MSKKKIVSIWGIGTAVLLVVCHIAIYLRGIAMMDELLPMYGRYARAAEVMYHPEDVEREYEKAKEEAAITGEVATTSGPTFLTLRGLMSDMVHQYENDMDTSEGGPWERLLGYCTTTTTQLFVCSDKEIEPFAYGYWKAVFRYDPDALLEQDKLNKMETRTAFGIFDMEQAIKQSYGAELIALVGEDATRTIRLDEYAQKGCVILPLHITVMEENGTVIKEYTPAGAADVPAGYEMVKAENVWIYNKQYQFAAGTMNYYYGNPQTLKSLREKSLNIAGKIDFEDTRYRMDEDFYVKRYWNFFHAQSIGYYISPSMYGGSANYAVVTGMDYDFWPVHLIVGGGVVVLWTVLWTIIVVVFQKRRHKDQ